MSSTTAAAGPSVAPTVARTGSTVAEPTTTDANADSLIFLVIPAVVIVLIVAILAAVCWGRKRKRAANDPPFESAREEPHLSSAAAVDTEYGTVGLRDDVAAGNVVAHTYGCAAVPPTATVHYTPAPQKPHS
jgi:hypothetical protein